MLVRLLYASRASEPAPATLMEDILATSLENNARNGITGVLCHGNGMFLQALEGGRMAVSRLYQAIARDPRHHDLVLLHYEEILEREFAGSAMGYVNTSKVNVATMLKYSPQAHFDPYESSGRASLALLGELIAGASIVTRASDRPMY
ncbi:BLUF domain-containing protein [Cupriavidus respiraculi]|uniref:BLUF domain-containing protein n=1 Tax=Cupriavidus respiraculi TaxID=195930 RepID=UPI001C982334|nr:BLUF domain-containing protein [Cupriavidus respiraculi]MBY4947174.1 BLUF domain-containing protein [Cupriavidus respiraculi]